MKKNFCLLTVLAFTVLTLFFSCKKETAPTDNAIEVQTHANDQSNFSTESEAVANEVNVALESNTYFGAFQSTINICGATAVADTISNPRTITITYNGNNCAGTHLRTGTVVLSMPAGIRWRNADAALTVNLQNLKIKRLADNKSITISGSQIFTNVSGGLLINLPVLQTVTHTTTSNNMTITFDDGTQRKWQVARKRVFSYNNGVVLTISGIGTEGALSNVAEWGINRFGHAFTTSITDPLVFRQDCSGRLTSGQVKHEGFAIATATFGLNASGAPIPCAGTGNFYFNLTWIGLLGNSHTMILPY